MRTYAYPVGMLSPVEAAFLSVVRSEPMGTLDAQSQLKSVFGLNVKHQSLYVTAQRMRDQGYIRTARAQPDFTKPHTITRKGLQVLVRACVFWQTVADV